MTTRARTARSGRSRWWRATAALLPLVLVAATCSDGDDPAAPSDASEDALPADLDDLDLAFVSDVAVSPPIVPPGYEIRITVEGHAPDAVVYVSHGDTEVSGPLDGSGQATLTLADDAPLGLHRVRIERNGILLGIGEVRVADGPGVWVRADRRYAGPDDVVTLRVASAGVPLDAPAIIVAPPDAAFEDDDWDDEDEWWDDDPAADLDWDDLDALGEQLDELRERLFEDLERDLADAQDLDAFDDLDDMDDGAALFRVHGSGWLVPIGPTQIDPSGLPTLADLVDRPIIVPGHLAELGGFRVGVARDIDAVLDPGAGNVIWSSPAPLVACNEPGEVSGSVTRPSVVRVLELTAPYRTASAVTDHDFQLPAGPGPALVTVTSLDLDGDEQAEVVDVTCGGAVQLASTPAAEPRVQPATWLPGQGPAGTGGTLVSSGGGQRDRCRHGYSTWHGTDAGLGASFGEWVTTVAFGALPRLHLLGQSDLRALLELEGQRQLLGAEDELVDLNELGLNLGQDVLFVTQYVGDGRNHALSVRAIDTRTGGQISRFGAQVRGANAEGLLDALEGPDFARFLDEVARSMLCVDVDPELIDVGPGDTEDVEVTVTDLADNGADDAEVTPSPEPECGDLHPTGGEWRVTGETLDLEFEATDRLERECTERIALEAVWEDGHPDEATGRSDPAEFKVRGRFKVEMDFRIDPETIAGAGVPLFFGFDASFEARNCDSGGILGPWEGELDIGGGFAGPFVGALDVEGAVPTTFMLPENGGTFPVPGLSELGLIGDYYAGGDVLVLTSLGYPWMVGDIETLAEDEPC